jgi:hypothetical protein
MSRRIRIRTTTQRASQNNSSRRVFRHLLSPLHGVYYERLGLLVAPHRSGGQRWYPPDAQDRVLLIRFASDMGLPWMRSNSFSIACGITNRPAPGGKDWRI